MNDDTKKSHVTEDDLLAHYHYVQAVVRNALRFAPYDDVLDVTQQTYLEALRSLARGRGPDAGVRPWLRAIANRHAWRHRRERAEIETNERPTDEDRLGAPDRRPAALGWAWDHLEARIRRDLGDESLRAFEALLRAGWEQADAAALLGKAPSTTNKFTQRLRDWLAEMRDGLADGELAGAVRCLLGRTSPHWEAVRSYVVPLLSREEILEILAREEPDKPAGTTAYFFLGEQRVRDAINAQDAARALRGLEARLTAHRLRDEEEMSKIEAVMDAVYYGEVDRYRAVARLIQVREGREFPFSEGTHGAKLDALLRRDERGRLAGPSKLYGPVCNFLSANAHETYLSQFAEVMDSYYSSPSEPTKADRRRDFAAVFAFVSVRAGTTEWEDLASFIPPAPCPYRYLERLKSPLHMKSGG